MMVEKWLCFNLIILFRDNGNITILGCGTWKVCWIYHQILAIVGKLMTNKWIWGYTFLTHSQILSRYGSFKAWHRRNGWFGMRCLIILLFNVYTYIYILYLYIYIISIYIYRYIYIHSLIHLNENTGPSCWSIGTSILAHIKRTVLICQETCATPSEPGGFEVQFFNLSWAMAFDHGVL